MYIDELFKEKYRVKSTRLSGWDYTGDGYYFVTICTKNCIDYFGTIKNGIMGLNDIGCVVMNYWNKIPNHFVNVKLDEFVIMPNHLHGILIIDNVGNKNYVGNKNFCSLQQQPISWQTKLSRSLSSIVRGFKIGVTKYFINNNNYDFKWQKSFYDHIIRNNQSLNNIREYIKNNPAKWMGDRNNRDGS